MLNRKKERKNIRKDKHIKTNETLRRVFISEPNFRFHLLPETKRDRKRSTSCKRERTGRREFLEAPQPHVMKGKGKKREKKYQKTREKKDGGEEEENAVECWGKFGFARCSPSLP